MQGSANWSHMRFHYTATVMAEIKTNKHYCAKSCCECKKKKRQKTEEHIAAGHTNGTITLKNCLTADIKLSI